MLPILVLLLLLLLGWLLLRVPRQWFWSRSEALPMM